MSRHAEGNAGTLVPPPTPHGHSTASLTPSSRAAVGAHSLMSFGKGSPENQDTFVHSANESGSKSFFAVFDGHGDKGGKMSNFARNSMTKNLFLHKDLQSDPRTALEAAYSDTQREIERHHGNEAALSGTTAVAAYQHRDRLLVANVGDSRAVLGRCDTARNNLCAVDLSDDQKPCRKDERKRIERLGGKVDQMAFPVMQGGGVRWMRGGPQRVMDRSGMGGLAMSRSLGDLQLRPFVSSVPELVERKLDDRDKVLVLGTDGVWDHVTSQEAVDIAGRNNCPISAAKEITSVARRRWQQETGGQLSDDITAVVVRLGDTGSASPSRHRNTESRHGAPQELSMSPKNSSAEQSLSPKRHRSSASSVPAETRQLGGSISEPSSPVKQRMDKTIDRNDRLPMGSPLQQRQPQGRTVNPSYQPAMATTSGGQQMFRSRSETSFGPGRIRPSTGRAEGTADPPSPGHRTFSGSRG